MWVVSFAQLLIDRGHHTERMVEAVATLQAFTIYSINYFTAIEGLEDLTCTRGGLLVYY